MELVNYILKFDTSLFLYLNSLHTPFFDLIMWHISARITWLPLYLILLAFLIKIYKKQSVLLIVFIILTVTIADQISVHFVKNVFERLRPCHNNTIAEYIHLVNNYCGGRFGFVSSHAVNTFSLAVFFSLLVKHRWATFLSLFWAAVVSYSRIYLGVHYPLDVFGGALLGSIISFFMYKIYILVQNRLNVE